MPFAFLAISVSPAATSRNAGSTKARAFRCAVGDAQVEGLRRRLGRARRPARKHDGVPTLTHPATAALLGTIVRGGRTADRIVELARTWSGEAAPRLLGGGVRSRPYRSNRMLIVRCLSRLPHRPVSHRRRLLRRRAVTDITPVSDYRPIHADAREQCGGGEHWRVGAWRSCCRMRSGDLPHLNLSATAPRQNRAGEAAAPQGS